MLSELRPASRLVAIDTAGTFFGIHRPLPGFEIFSSIDALRTYICFHLHEKFRVIFQPSPYISKALQFEQVARLAIKCKRMVLAVDEIDTYCSPTSLCVMDSRKYARYFGDEEPALYQLANYSRHHFLALYGVSRRPQQVARELTAQCLEVRSFVMTEALDVEAMRGRFQDAADRLPHLAQFCYLSHRDGEPVREHRSEKYISAA
jgi:hypothetical protein